MPLFRDFEATILLHHPSSCQKTPRKVCDDLSWWNYLLSKFDGFCPSTTKYKARSSCRKKNCSFVLVVFATNIRQPSEQMSQFSKNNFCFHDRKLQTQLYTLQKRKINDIFLVPRSSYRITVTSQYQRIRNTTNTIAISARAKEMGQFKADCLHQHHNHSQQASITEIVEPSRLTIDRGDVYSSCEGHHGKATMA